MVRLLILVGALVASSLLAQLPTPTLDRISPPGGQAGTEITVALSGANLTEVRALQFSDPRIEAERVLRPADEIWPEPRPDGLKFRVRLPAELPPGLYEARADGQFGISSSRLFHVSSAQAPADALKSGKPHAAETAIPLDLEQTISASTTPQTADYYRLSLTAGQRVLIHCWASRIDSRLDATLHLLDAKGTTLASSRNVIGPDPLLDFRAQESGDFFIKVHDVLFRGGATYPYRLQASNGPWLDAVFPPSGTAGTTASFTLIGRNLPDSTVSTSHQEEGIPLESVSVTRKVPDQPDSPALSGVLPRMGTAASFPVSLSTSPPIRIGIASHPVAEPETDLLPVPSETYGRFEFRGNVDSYRFSASKGQSLWLEVIAHRQGSSLDPYLFIEQISTAPEGGETRKVLAEADDLPIQSTLVGFDGRTRDPGLRFTVPQDGIYQASVGNHANNAGSCHGYRLLIEEARPGFELIAVEDRNHHEPRQSYPGTPVLRPGMTTAIRVLALRKGGYTGPITLTAKGLPKGVTARPATIWQSASEGFVVLSAAADAASWSGTISLEGEAEGVRVPARSGSLSWGTSDSTKDTLHSRLTAGLPLSVLGDETSLISIAPAEDKEWEVELGKQLELPLKIQRHKSVKGNVAVTPVGLPNFRRPPSINLAEKDSEGTLKVSFRVDSNNKPFASSGTFVLKATGTVTYQPPTSQLDRYKAWQTHLVELEKSKPGPNVEAAKKEIEALLKSATEASKAKDLKFTIYSEPVRLKIVDPNAK